jgi:hypothetical protein
MGRSCALFCALFAGGGLRVATATVSCVYAYRNGMDREGVATPQDGGNCGRGHVSPDHGQGRGESIGRCIWKRGRSQLEAE